MAFKYNKNVNGFIKSKIQRRNFKK